MGARFGHRARVYAVGSAVATLTLSAALHAESHIPFECGSREVFDAKLRERLGAAAALDDVHVHIEPKGERFHLRVQIGSDVRELEDPSCTELFRAAVVIALAVLMRDESPATAPPPKPAAPPPPPVSPPRPRSTYPQLGFAAGAGVVVGSLPKPVLGLELESKALWHRFGVGVDLRYLFAAEKRDSENKGVKLEGFGFGAASIFRPAPRWEARLGLAAQRFTGYGKGSIAARRDDVSWALGPTLGLGFTALAERPFWLGLGAEGQLNALRARFQIRNYSREISDQPQDLFVSPWLTGSAFVRFGLLF